MKQFFSICVQKKKHQPRQVESICKKSKNFVRIILRQRDMDKNSLRACKAKFHNCIYIRSKPKNSVGQ